MPSLIKINSRSGTSAISASPEDIVAKACFLLQTKDYRGAQTQLINTCLIGLVLKSKVHQKINKEPKSLDCSNEAKFGVKK
jgi:hypothetical protein